MNLSPSHTPPAFHINHLNSYHQIKRCPCHQYRCCQLWFVFTFQSLLGVFIHGATKLSCVAPVNVMLITVDQLKLLLLMAVRIKCTDSFLGVPNFIFSFSSSFSALFLSNSICLQFSSCARTNILTKLSRVDTTTRHTK